MMPQRGMVRLAVAAAGVNRPDILQAQGLYPPPKGSTDILGLEVAGTVIAVGQGVTRWRKGDAVCALLDGGGYAAEVDADAGLCLPIPSGLSWSEAAGLPEGLCTLVNLLGATLPKARSILIHGGTGGVGHLAVQVAKAYGLYVYATVGSDDKARLCASLGADTVINYRTQDFAEIIQNNNLYNRVDVVLDCVGAPYFAQHLKILAHDGVLAQMAFQGGDALHASMLPLLLKRLTWRGATLRSLPMARKRRIVRAVEKNIWPFVRDNGIRSLLYAVYPLDKWHDAHAALLSGAVAGKIALIPS